MILADNQAALAVVLVASIVVPLLILGSVLLMMWRSSRRHPD